MHRVASGGTSSVVSANHVKDGNLVVIKVFHREKDEDPRNPDTLFEMKVCQFLERVKSPFTECVPLIHAWNAWKF